MTQPMLIIFLAAFIAPSLCATNNFLSRELPSLVEDSKLLEALTSVLSGSQASSVQSRGQKYEALLQPTFYALPRNSNGRIDASAVRYLLHRYFVDKHGWFIRSLQNRGEALNATSLSTILVINEDGTESDEGLDHKLDRQGYSLSQVALVAAALESLVHTESIERLRATFEIVGAPRDAATSEQQMQEIVTTYMQLFILGLHHQQFSKKQLTALLPQMPQVYPNWGETLKWVGNLRAEVLSTGAGVGDAMSFNTTMQVLELMAERYGRWQNRECLELKNMLTPMEHRGSGRVPLSAFYQSALNGNWQFSESQGYLRQLGALDEEDPSRPSIIIANYVNAPSNCLASSEFYSTCCIDECEALMGHIEVQLAAPRAKPSAILELVQQLPSSTVEAPRLLPEVLQRRLEDIAEHHGGMVPLHGRLFSQWLHNVYPRECPYPQVSGTSKPMLAKEWEVATGERIIADKETMSRHIMQAATHHGDGTIPWSIEEELFVAPAPEVEGGVRGFVRGLALVAVALSSSWIIAKGAAGSTLATGKLVHSEYSKYAV